VRPRLFTLKHNQLLAQRGKFQAEAVSADEERTAIGDHRENERYHHLTWYPLMADGTRRRSKLLIL